VGTQSFGTATLAWHILRPEAAGATVLAIHVQPFEPMGVQCHAIEDCRRSTQANGQSRTRLPILATLVARYALPGGCSASGQAQTPAGRVRVAYRRSEAVVGWEGRPSAGSGRSDPASSLGRRSVNRGSRVGDGIGDTATIATAHRRQPRHRPPPAVNVAGYASKLRRSPPTPQPRSSIRRRAISG